MSKLLHAYAGRSQLAGGLSCTHRMLAGGTEMSSIAGALLLQAHLSLGAQGN